MYKKTGRRILLWKYVDNIFFRETQLGNRHYSRPTVGGKAKNKR